MFRVYLLNVNFLYFFEGQIIPLMFPSCLYKLIDHLDESDGPENMEAM